MRIFSQSFGNWIDGKVKARLIRKQEACNHNKKVWNKSDYCCLKCGVRMPYGEPAEYGSDNRIWFSRYGWYDPVVIYRTMSTYLEQIEQRRKLLEVQRILQAKETLAAYQQSCQHSWRAHRDHSGNESKIAHTCTKCGVPRYGSVYYYGQRGNH